MEQHSDGDDDNDELNLNIHIHFESRKKNHTKKSYISSSAVGLANAMKYREKTPTI